MRHQDDELHELIRRHLAAAKTEAANREGYFSSDELARLEGLSRLVELSQTATPASSRKRWPMAAALVSTLLIASVLLFARVPTTEIELDVRAAYASFLIPTNQVLTDLTNLSALGVSGLEEIQLPANASAMRSATAFVKAMDVAPGTTENGSLTLPPLALPAGTRVTIQTKDRAHQYRVSLAGNPVTMQMDVSGALGIAVNGAPLQLLDFATPQPVMMHADSGTIDLDLTLPSDYRDLFVSQLNASELSFLRIDEFNSDEQTLVRHVSTIQSGTLYYEALNGLKHELRAGEALRFGTATGVIRTLELKDGHLVIKFRGQVSRMRTGWDEAGRSLMPTYLSWLSARHGLALLWGTTLYLFGLIATVLRWWGIRL